MITHGVVAQRFAEQAGKPDADFRQLLLPSAQNSNLRLSYYDHRELLSYGTHFPLARIMLDEDGERSWWLLNGDSYSHSTTQHQALVRSALKATGLPMLIVPFSCLREAGIVTDSIKWADIQDDRFETIEHSAASKAEVPEDKISSAYPDGDIPEDSYQREYYAYLGEDDRWHWQTSRHWLGASVFSATYRLPGTKEDAWMGTEHTAHFLSAFDEQETNPLYFLAELPQGVQPATVEEALQALKPAEVVAYEALQATYPEVYTMPVTRQGDVFAVPTNLSTRNLSMLGERYKAIRVLGVNHTATEVVPVLVPDDTLAALGATRNPARIFKPEDARNWTWYARGILRHVPEGWGRWARRPEHKRQKMGDGKTWHLLVKNTVPMVNGRSRSWSRGGNVD